MNPPLPPDDADRALRDALHAETEGVEAPHSLLERITAEPPRAQRPPGWLLAVATVAALVVGVGGALLLADDDEPVDTVDDPTTTTEPVNGLGELLDRGVFSCDYPLTLEVFVAAHATDAQVDAIVDRMVAAGSSEPERVDAEALRARLLDLYPDDPDTAAVIESSEIPSLVLLTFDQAERDVELRVRSEVSDLPGVVKTISTDCTDPPTPVPTPTGERPTVVALVREDGMLMTVDLETGKQKNLYFGGDPSAPPAGQEEGGPQFIDGVDISPDGQWVYFSTCCEPVVGRTFRIPAVGGETTEVGQGAYPRVSPDGRHLATSGCQFVFVTPIEGGEGTSLEVDDCVGRLAWSPDGRQLAAMTSVGPGETAQMLLFDWDGTTLTPADPGKPDNPGVHVAWSPDGMVTTISGGGSVDSSRSLSQDASYLWLLWVDETGVVREQASLASGELPEIPGLPRAIAADW